MATYKTEPKWDKKRKQFYRYVGRNPSNGAQVKLYLGSDADEAQDRLGGIMQLYEASADASGSWTLNSLSLAKDLAKHGESSRVVEVAQSVGDILDGKDQPKPTGQTLHEALDWFLIKKKKVLTNDDGSLKQTWGTDRSQIESLKQFLSDVDFAFVDYDVVDSWHEAIRCRPVSAKTGKRLAYKTAQNYLKKLREALKAIHLSTKWEFRLPADYQFMKTEISGNAEDPSPTHLSLEQLILLNQYANKQDRLVLYLALNLAGGASEIGQLLLDEVLLEEHRTKGKRPKTSVPNEHHLFGATIKEIEEYLKARPKSKEPTLLVTQRGTRTYRASKSGNLSSTLPDRFRRMQERIKKDHPDWKMVPFNSLRDTMAQMVKEIDPYASELVLSHKHPLGATQSIHYTTQHFDALFAAQQKIEQDLQPFFDAATDDVGKQVIGYDKRRRALELSKLGVPKTRIARDLGVHVSTVFRWLDSSK